MAGLATSPESLKAQYEIIRDLRSAYLAQYGDNANAAKGLTIIALEALGWTRHDAEVGFTRATELT